MRARPQQPLRRFRPHVGSESARRQAPEPCMSHHKMLHPAPKATSTTSKVSAHQVTLTPSQLLGESFRYMLPPAPCAIARNITRLLNALF